MTSILQADFCCSDCEECFKSASQLLTHFALHASQKQTDNIYLDNKVDSQFCNSPTVKFPQKTQNIKKNNVPDLYPISTVKREIKKFRTDSKNVKYDLQSRFDNCISNLPNSHDKKSHELELYEYLCLASHTSSIKYENEMEDFCPLKYCSVTMDETKQITPSLLQENSDKCFVKPGIAKIDSDVSKSSKLNFSMSKKKYPCTICSKVFGWSTDLKRHVLTHTGERPFKCNLCDSCFTRNFLLQKHKSKTHSSKKEWKITTKGNESMPSLTPICRTTNQIKTKDSRKQDKQKIKRKTFSSKSLPYEEIFYGINKMNQLNLIDKGTLVQ